MYHVFILIVIPAAGPRPIELQRSHYDLNGKSILQMGVKHRIHSNGMKLIFAASFPFTSLHSTAFPLSFSSQSMCCCVIFIWLSYLLFVLKFLLNQNVAFHFARELHVSHALQWQWQWQLTVVTNKMPVQWLSWLSHGLRNYLALQSLPPPHETKNRINQRDYFLAAKTLIERKIFFFAITLGWLMIFEFIYSV